MKQIIKSFGWFLYGGVSCYCIQRFLVDFLYIKHNENELFQSGDIVVLDIWNRLKLNRNNLICAKSPENHQQTIVGHVIAFQDESVNIRPVNKRIKFVQIPKGSIAIELLTNDNHQEIKILPIGLIEGRTLARFQCVYLDLAIETFYFSFA
ncbi:unnamed protein product [Rotaria magnacalcarata]